MKKVRFLLLLSFVLVVSRMNANMILLPETKVRVQITNLSEFADMAVVAYNECNSFKKAELIKDVLPLAVYYCPKKFYIIKTEYLKKVGIDNVDWNNDKHVQLLNVIYDWGKTQPDLYSTFEVDFKLAKKNSTYYVYKTKIAGKYWSNLQLQLLGKSQAEGVPQTPSEIVKNFKDDVIDPLKPINISEIQL